MSERTALYDVIPADWIHDPEVAQVGVSCFTTSILGVAEHAQIAFQATKSLMPGKWMLLFGTNTDEEKEISISARWIYRSDSCIVDTRQTMTTVPPGNYIYLLAPIIRSGLGTSESYWRARVDFTRGLLTALYGHTAMQEEVYHLRLQPGSRDQTGAISPVLEVHLDPSHWRAFEDQSFLTLKALTEAEYPEPECSQAQLALQFVGRLANELDTTIRFTFAWIALEVAAGGHGAAERFLNSLSPNFGSTAKRLKDMRNDLFHRGIKPDLSQADERLLISCVLGLILSKVGIQDSGLDRLVSEYAQNPTSPPAPSPAPR